MKHVFRSFKQALVRVGVLARAAGAAVTLGFIETITTTRGRRLLVGLAIVGVVVWMVVSPPVRAVGPGEVGLRVNRITGAITVMPEGPGLVVPGIHALKRVSIRDRVYRAARSSRASGEAPFQTVEGLSVGVEVAIRYGVDPARIATIARSLPEDIGRDLIEPVVDGILHRTFARHTVREVFSGKRTEIEQALETELRQTLGPTGVLVRAVYLGSVDLPPEYRKGLEGLLAEELAADKMRFTLALKEKAIQETTLQAEADKAKREKAAEAAALEEIIAARGKAEAMKHVLPFKEKEIEQRRLEAEAQKVTRLKQAEGEADARRIESLAEADTRRKLAEADAYRIEVTGKASAEQLARESALIARNPLLIQKTLADRLGDKVQVIVAPAQSGGFIAQALLGAQRPAPAAKDAAGTKPKATTTAKPTEDEGGE
ncbi:MAG TPA: SPFH domain-containing protein [Polyangia bacterium]|jgi:regulator of protease activity HflC (stomatin/prohibitin superfamily)